MGLLTGIPVLPNYIRKDHANPLKKLKCGVVRGLKALRGCATRDDKFTIEPYLASWEGTTTTTPQRPAPEFEPLRKLPGTNTTTDLNEDAAGKLFMVDTVEVKMETNHIVYVWQFDLGEEIEEIRFSSHESLVCNLQDERWINSYRVLNASEPSLIFSSSPSHTCEGVQLDEILPDIHLLYNGTGTESVESLASLYSISEQSFFETRPTSVDDIPIIDCNFGVEISDCYMVLEEILEEMLRECLESIPLTDFPLLTLPDLDPETLSSLGLSPILRPEIRTTYNPTRHLANPPRGHYSLRPLPREISPPPYIDPEPPVSPRGCEAPPPFPQDVTEIVDLVRMAASLIDSVLRGNADLRELDFMTRLVQPWPDNSLTAIQGIELFREALNDGVLLFQFLLHLAPNLKSSMTPSYRPIPLNSKINFYRFIRVYKSINNAGDNADVDSLRYAGDGTLNGLPIEDLTSYARAIIMVHSHFSSKCGQPSFDVSNDTGCSSMDLAGPSTKDSETKRRYEIYQTLGLPEDDFLLYQQLLSNLRNEENHKKIARIGNDEIQSLVNLLQHLLTFPQITGSDRTELLTFLVRFSSDAILYPQSLALVNDPQIDKEPVTCGYFGDILRGYVKDQGVCVKVIKVYHKTQKAKNEKFLKSFVREIVIWGQLQHPNILPFYGVYHLDDNSDRICLVSPWMENGTLLEYVNANPETDRLLLVCDVVCGLDYLHTNTIVHGDLKSINVLVTVHGRACIADFGLSSIDRTETIKVLSIESTGIEGGTPRYEAPELLEDTENRIYRTTASDMYAFGSICYEIYTGMVPFYEIVSPYTVMAKIMRGEIPERPILDISPTEWGLTDEMWSIITSCWRKIPEERPSAQTILNSGLLSGVVDTRLEDQEIWTPSKYRSALHYATNDTTQAVAREMVEAFG